MELNELGKLLGEHNKSGNGYQIHLNSGNIDVPCGKNMDVEFSDIYFTGCEVLNEGKLLVFDNDKQKPVAYKEDGTPLYSETINSNMYINVVKITAIEDAVDKENWFIFSSARVINVYMSYGNIITIGFRE